MNYVSLPLFLLTLLATSHISLGYPKPDENFAYNDGSEREEIAKNKPKMISQNSEKIGKEGEDVTFPCEVEDLGNLGITWIKHVGSSSKNLFLYGTPVQPLDSRIHLNGNNLLIKNVVQSDHGTYQCKVSSEGDISVNHTFIVTGPPQIVMFPADGKVKVLSGQTIEMRCQAQPKPEIKWEKLSGGIEIFDDEREILRIENAGRNDAGHYRCSAFQSYGAVSYADFFVTVEEPPEVIVNEILNTGLGLQVELKCKAFGVPKPTIRIYNHRGITLAEKENTDELVHVMKIESEKDFGKYKCFARNKHGADSKEFEVTGRPFQPEIDSDTDSIINGDKYELRYKVVSYSPLTKILISFRDIKDGDDISSIPWNHTEIEATSESTGPTYQASYNLQNLVRSTYEIQITAYNKFGPSKKSETLSITADGSSEHWKVAGSSSYRIKPSSSSSISVITCLVLFFTFCLSRRI